LCSAMAEAEKRTAAAPDPPDIGSPLVVACLDPADLRPEVNPLTGAVHADRRRADLSAADGAALEYALRAGEAWGGQVLAVAAGPPSVDPVLRQAMALGARALRVPYGSNGLYGSEGPDGSNGPHGSKGTDGPEPVAPEDLAGTPGVLAGALAAAIKAVGAPALVVCGDRSPTRGIGAVPALLAHHLGAAQALGLVSLSVHDHSLTVRAERRLDGGWREGLRLQAPAVCSVEAAGVRLRRAPLAASLRSASEAVPVAAEPVASPSWFEGLRVGAPRPYRPRTKVVPAPAGDTRDRLLALTGALRSHDPPRLVGPVGPDEGADEVLGYLAAHGYLSADQIGK
jgi:electron transfer flavoprotein beta subunit